MDPCSGPMFSTIQWKWAASQETMDLPNGDIHYQLITLWHTYFHHCPLMTTHHSTAVTCAGKTHALYYNELFLKLNMVHTSLCTLFFFVFFCLDESALHICMWVSLVLLEFWPTLQKGKVMDIFLCVGVCVCVYVAYVCVLWRHVISEVAQTTKYLYKYIRTSLLTETHNCQQSRYLTAFNRRPSESGWWRGSSTTIHSITDSETLSIVWVWPR